MLRTIVRFCLLHPWLVLGIAAIVMAFGIATVDRTQYDVFPEFVPAQATIQTEAPGLVAEQVEALVTRPLEDAINGANGVASVRSESAQGLSVINIAFRDGSDPYRARQVIAESISEAAAKLPTIANTPRLSPLTSSTMDLLKVGFVSDRLDPAALRDLIQWTVRPRLLATPGVAHAIVFGGALYRIEVRVKPTSLIASGASMSDVGNAVSALSGIRGGGFAETANQRILVQPVAGRVTVDTVAAAPVVTGNGVALTVGALADVVEAPSPKFGDALIMGRSGVLVAMASQYGANTLDATRAVEATLADLRPTLEAQGVTMYPSLHRPANFIEAALHGIGVDLLIGAVMIALVLLVFLRNVRIALIAFLSIPLSLLTALIVLDRLGLTINTMTLGGLAVALGVVVDDAIVDIENIVRRLREDAGADRIAIIEAAAVEVRAPVVYATYVLAFTIAPILFLTGLQGAFFAPLALSFLLAVLASLAVAMTVTPALASLLLARIGPVEESTLLDRIKLRHSRLLVPLFERPREVVGASVLVAIVGVAAFASFGSELLPAFREGHYVLKVNGPSGASIGWMRDVGTKISRDLLAVPQIATVEQQIGRAEAGEDTFGPNRSEMHVELKPLHGASEAVVVDRIRAILADYPAINSEILSSLGDRIAESLSGETAAVAINIYGADLDVLDRSAAQIASVLAKVPGAADVQVKSPPGTPVLSIALDSARMGLRGVSPTDAYDAIEATFQGRVVAQAPAADRVTDIALTLPPELRRDPESVGDVLVRAADGGSVRLSDIATIRLTEGRAQVLREGGQRRQVVTANPTRADIAGFVADARSTIKKGVKLPPGVSVAFGGVAEGQKAASRQIALNVAVASVAIVALLVLAFGGGRAATLILAGTPFALAGGVIAVAFTGGVLSLGALVGFVTLFGVAARNAILLVSHVDHLVAAEAAPWGPATVLRAARERVTPILITALVTALGLAPLALEAGQAGREVQGPMAIVILGGLVTSTVMSLILLPALILRYRRSAVTALGD
ncbi:efflux RND transporter permease subunit [Sphingomonas sp. SUN039]|uniref:efflux RND transporter permease subunit n=1 Tax=Sphingomonas sp. SUN039 TaxID=2937787 RepID=UPI00216472F1|nr:efflux RND transporter permease subunit [Sphingomonas sp. SUN039]UVO53750.1 efflux RND transporter permease subunit [Sphingomonas sp. SUN039]